MTILIGGGTGFVGQNLVKHLLKNNFKVLVVTRTPRNANEINWKNIETSGLPEGIKAVVNVAGCQLIDMPFRYLSKNFKKQCYDSRVGTNRILAKAIRESKIPPDLFLTLSGVGYYPSSLSDQYNENGPNGTNWLASLAKDWEVASILPTSVPVRRAVIRPGVVLGAGGGVMDFHKQMLSLAPLVVLFGTGNQFVPWIHMTDLVRLIQYIIENKNMKGVYNGVAPQSVRATQFGFRWTQLHTNKSSKNAHFPAWIVKALFGEDASALLLEGQDVNPLRVQRSEFKYEYGDLKSALTNIYQHYRKS